MQPYTSFYMTMEFKWCLPFTFLKSCATKQNKMTESAWQRWLGPTKPKMFMTLYRKISRSLFSAKESSLILFFYRFKPTRLSTELIHVYSFGLLFWGFLHSWNVFVFLCLHTAYSECQSPFEVSQLPKTCISVTNCTFFFFFCHYYKDQIHDW